MELDILTRLRIEFFEELRGLSLFQLNITSENMI